MSSLSPSLGVNGFQQMRQSDWTSFLNSQWTQAFGNNVNLDVRSNLGQLTAIMAERFALLSELAEAIYQQGTVGGAQGVGVDNLLALVGLTRLPASATVTQPTPVVEADGVTFYGLAILGTPGTLVPAGTLLSDSASPPHQFSLDASVTIAPSANAVQNLIFSATPTSGTFSLTLTAPSGDALTTGSLPANVLAQQAHLAWPQAPTSGSFTLSAAGSTTPSQPYNVTAAALGAALSALTNTSITVSGSVAAGMTVSFPAGPIPIITPSTDASAPQVVQAAQASLSVLADGTTLPFSDISLSAAGNVWTLTFGAYSPASGQPSSGARPQPLLAIAASSLLAGNTVVQLSASSVTAGAVAQAIGSATCTTTGAIPVAAGALTQVVTGVSGVTGCRNDLDCVTGSAGETDTQAMLRRASLLSARAQGPLSAIVQQVSAVPGVTTALAYANRQNAAQQVLTFSAVPVSGSYVLLCDAGATAAIAGTATAGQVQAALQALPGYGQATVSGSPAYGMQVDFGGADGGQAVPLMQVQSNTTGCVIQPVFGRPPHSVELVVQGGSDAAVAQAIFAAAPAGIASYGAPVLRTTASVAAGSTALSASSAAGLAPGMLVIGSGISPGTQIAQLSGNAVTLTAAAVAQASNAPFVFGYGALLADANNNPVLVRFSRPQVLPVYVSLSLVTDWYLVPGNPASGTNPASQFTPASVATITSDIAASINAVPIGGTLVALGTNGLLSCFSQVPGIVSFTMTFGLSPNPTTASNISLLPAQTPLGAAETMSICFT